MFRNLTISRSLGIATAYLQAVFLDPDSLNQTGGQCREYKEVARSPARRYF